MDIIHVSENEFEEKVLKAEKPVIVDFWADWCGPCQMLAPELEAIAKERDDLAVAKVNVDENMALAGAFGINSIPAVLLFRDGQAVAASIGYRPKDDLLDALHL